MLGSNQLSNSACARERDHHNNHYDPSFSQKKKLNFAIPRDFHSACSPFIADRVLCIDANIIQLYSCHVRLWPPLAKNNAETESGTNYNDRVPGP